MVCRYRLCSTRLTSAQDARGAFYCCSSHRTSAFKLRRAAKAVALLNALAVASLTGDESRVLALVEEGERLLGLAPMAA